MFAALLHAIRARPLPWAGIALGFVAAYHALLLGAMVVRFGHAPNFLEVYDVVEAYRLTFSGTPSLLDAITIAAGEPWLDIGYMSPTWRMSEWSLMILPPQLLLVTLTGGLLATYVAARRSAGASCRRAPAFAAGLGAGFTGIANATLFWVVCCATPTWVVGLSMLGLPVSVAFLIEPVGPLITAAGVALLVWATLAQSRRPAAVPAASRVPLLPLQRSA